MCRGSDCLAGDALSVQTFVLRPSPALPLAFLPAPRCWSCWLPGLTRACMSPCPSPPLSLAPAGRGPVPSHCCLATLPRGLCAWGEPVAGRTPSPLLCGGHSSSILLGIPLQPLTAAPPGPAAWSQGYQGRVPSPVLCVSSQGPAIYLYLHAQGTQSLAAGPSPAPTKPSASSLPLQKYICNSRERQRRREKERQRLCLHAPVQSSLLMRRIWLLVSRGVCPVG